MPQSINLLLVDSQRLFRDCLAIVLNRRRHLRVVGEADAGGRALELALTLRPDVVVLDLTVPEGGQDLVSALAAIRPAPSILILGDADGSEAASALQAGAQGYLPKDSALDDLVRVIERVHIGELVVASGPAAAVFREGSFGVSDPVERSLTSREIDVLHLVVQGRTNAEIARELQITDHTVKAHIARIRGKLALDNRVQLTAFAFQRGLLRPEGGTILPERSTDH